MVVEKRRLFEWDYVIRFGLICVIALSVIIMIWTYEFTSNEIISLNESNEREFFDNLEELKLESEWGTYRNIEEMGQRKVSVVEINREDYGISPRAFLSLPFVPYDWGKLKYAFDEGYFSVLSKATSDYYLQPEFYDGWDPVGVSFYRSPASICKAGFFAAPSGQRIYTRPGSSIETFMLVYSSFCVGNPQAVSFESYYPIDGVTDDGLEYIQDPYFVERYITLDFEPNELVLGKTYPRFDVDWAQKVKVVVSVSRDAPRGLYMVYVNSGKYVPYFEDREDINKEAYMSKGGSPLMYMIIAVD